MNKIIKKAAAVVTALAVLAAVFVFDLPEKITAEAATTGGCSGRTGMTKWTTKNSLPATGNYYLNANVNLSDRITITGNLTLCLNGQTIKAASNRRIFFINEGCTLTLCDCKGTGKLIGSDISGDSCVIAQSQFFLNSFPKQPCLFNLRKLKGNGALMLNRIVLSVCSGLTQKFYFVFGIACMI